MSGQVIAVTGASRGIGAAIALELARRGHTVGCLTRKGAGVETAPPAAELAARMVNIACDVTDEAALRSAFAALAGRAGRIDGLVNNAGIHLDGRSAELQTGVYDQVMATNARAVFVACREAIATSPRAAGPSSTSARSSTSSASSATSPTAHRRPRSARSRAASRSSGHRRRSASSTSRPATSRPS